MSWIGYFYVWLAIFGIALTGCDPSGSDLGSPDGPTIVPVDVLKTESLPEYSYPTTFYGRVNSARRSPLSFEIPGKVVSLLVDEGEQVTVGQPLAHLDTSLIDVEKKQVLAKKRAEETLLSRLKVGEREEVIDAARAIVARTEAQIERAKLELSRVEGLLDRNAISKSEFEQVLYETKSLQATLAASKARLQELEAGTRKEDIEIQRHRVAELQAQIASLDVRLGKATLHAPYSAQVLQRRVDEGAVVKESQTIFQVADYKKFEARFSLPIDQLNHVKDAGSVSVNDAQLPIENVRIISTVSSETGSVDVLLGLADPASLIDGQPCTITLTETVQTECVELPISAIASSVRGLWSCFRLVKEEGSENFRVVREEITIHHTDGDRVFVETSLPEDSIVVSRGIHKLVPGMLVQIRDGNQ